MPTSQQFTQHKQASDRKALNVLWIMTDQHHAGCMGVAGHPDVKTPNLDRLAFEGVNFTRAYCNSPICGPSRSCFLSGQYTISHGITGNNIRNVRTLGSPNVGAVFKASGYETALIGKAHLPKHWVDEGFSYIRFCDLTDSDRHDPRTCHYFQHLVDTGWADDFDTASLPPDHPGFGNEPFISKIPYEHSLERWTGNEALAFLQNRSKDKPFFAQVSFERPHPPLSPAPEYAALYDPGKLSLPSNAVDFPERGLFGKPEFMRRFAQERQGIDPYVPRSEEALRKNLAYYYTLISNIDQEIGRILEHLETTGELEHTIICYNADHGDFAGEHGFTGKNFGTPEAVHRIPFLLKIPDGPSGMKISSLIESIDLFPTLCELAGVSIPPGIDGISVLPLIQNSLKPDFEKDHVFCHWDSSLPNQSSVISIRTKDYRFVFYADAPDDGELYDLSVDPGELVNLYHAKEISTVLNKLTHLALMHLVRFPRVHGIAHDRIANREEAMTPARSIHKHGKTWSEVFPLLTNNCSKTINAAS